MVEEAGFEPTKCPDSESGVLDQTRPLLHIWWTLRESNSSDFLIAKQMTTPCSPKAQKWSIV